MKKENLESLIVFLTACICGLLVGYILVDAFYRAQWNAKRAIVSAETKGIYKRVASTLDKAYYLRKICK